jgi:hypothetical protein
MAEAGGKNPEKLEECVQARTGHRGENALAGC